MSGIAYVTIIYFFVGILIARIFDAVYGKFDEADFKRDGKINTLKLTLDLLVHISLYAILFYILRNVVERIPFPLEGFGGYQHHRLKELEGGPIMEIVGLLFQKNLKEKVILFMKEVLGETIRD
jgi:hypothetical protein